MGQMIEDVQLATKCRKARSSLQPCGRYDTVCGHDNFDAILKADKNGGAE